MGGEFHLVDLESQAAAVQRFLWGTSHDDKIAWLRFQGTVFEIPERQHFPKLYVFESNTGRRSVFFVKDDQFVFVGDHTTYTVEEDDTDPA